MKNHDKLAKAAARCLRKADHKLAELGISKPPIYLRKAAAKMFYAIERWKKEEAERKLGRAFGAS